MGVSGAIGGETIPHFRRRNQLVPPSALAKGEQPITLVLVSELCSDALQLLFAAGSRPAIKFLCPPWYVAGMKCKYLLILEGETGKGFSAWLPDLPGVYAAGDSQRQVKVLAKEAADDKVAERDTLPTPPHRTSRQIDLLLDGILTDEKLSAVYIELEVPEALFVVRKMCRYEAAENQQVTA